VLVYVVFLSVLVVQINKYILLEIEKVVASFIDLHNDNLLNINVLICFTGTGYSPARIARVLLVGGTSSRHSADH
jgi:hypothetical protein